MSRIHAIVLAGGQGKRMGHVDKALVRVGGVRLIDAMLRGLPGPEIVTVVSANADLDLPEGIRQVSEKPVLGGPVAGIAAAFDDTCPHTMVLSIDAPRSHELISPMYHRLREDDAGDVVVPVDSEGVRQPLCALWRTDALRSALDAVEAANGGLHRAAARWLLDNAEVTEIPGNGAEADYDTVEQLSELGEVELPEQD